MAERPKSSPCVGLFEKAGSGVALQPTKEVKECERLTVSFSTIAFVPWIGAPSNVSID